MDPETPSGQTPGEHAPGTPAPGGQPQAAPEAGSDTFTREYVEQIRREAAGYRTELGKLKTAQQQREQTEREAQSTAQQLADARANDLEATQATLRQKDLQVRALELAADLGITKPKHALKLVEADVEFDPTTGEPTNLERLLKAIVKEVPGLAAAAPPPPPPPPPAAGSPTNPAKTPTLTRDIVAAMTPAQVNARWGEVEQFLKDNPNL